MDLYTLGNILVNILSPIYFNSRILNLYFRFTLVNFTEPDGMSNKRNASNLIDLLGKIILL